MPNYFSQAVITGNRREATLAFGIRLMPLSRQQRVIDYMRAQLHPPPGITAQLAGLPVLAAQANADLCSAGRRLLTLLAGLIAVGLVLLAVFRERERALVPLIPIVLATGWSALILFLIGIPLNPMSAAMGTLVIAISTEFSVLLSERFRQERRDGYEPEEALTRTYRFTGAAVLASGITAIAGFGVLDPVEHHDAPRLRVCHARRLIGLALRRAAGAPGGAGAVRARGARRPASRRRPLARRRAPAPSPPRAGRVSDEPEEVPGREGPQARPEQEPRRRLDPDRAAAARRTARRRPPQAIDTRRYQRVIGLFGLLLVIVISVSFITSRGTGTAGVTAWSAH